MEYPPSYLPKYLGGLDPGLKGALTLIQTSPFRILTCCGWNMTKRKGYSRAKASVNLYRFISPIGLSYDFKNVLIAVEDSQSHPGQGLSSTHGFGLGRGVAEGILYQMGAQLVYVSPAKWKRHMGLSGDKHESVRRASLIFESQEWKKLKQKDHDRAESLLLALWLMWDIAHSIVSPQTHGKFGLMS